MQLRRRLLRALVDAQGEEVHQRPGPRAAGEVEPGMEGEGLHHLALEKVRQPQAEEAKEVERGRANEQAQGAGLLARCTPTSARTMCRSVLNRSRRGRAT